MCPSPNPSTTSTRRCCSTARCSACRPSTPPRWPRRSGSFATASSPTRPRWCVSVSASRSSGAATNGTPVWAIRNTWPSLRTTCWPPLGPPGPRAPRCCRSPGTTTTTSTRDWPRQRPCSRTCGNSGSSTTATPKASTCTSTRRSSAAGSSSRSSSASAVTALAGRPTHPSGWQPTVGSAPRRPFPTGARSDAFSTSDGGADPLVLLAGDLRGVLAAEVVEVHAVGLPRRERRDRRDDPDAEGETADDQRHVRPSGGDRRVEGRQEGGDHRADVLRHGEPGDAGLRGEQLLVERGEDGVVALVDHTPHQDREDERQRCVALADRPQVDVGQRGRAQRPDDDARPPTDPV